MTEVTIRLQERCNLYEKYYDLCENDPNVKALMDRYELTREVLKRLYELFAKIGGLGKGESGKRNFHIKTIKGKMKLQINLKAYFITNMR